MTPTLQLDTRVFNQVMQRYSALNRKTFPEIVNAKALDVSFRALKETAKAAVQAIKALADKPWWPKFIAKRLREKQGKFTREEARRFSKNVIAGRVRAVAFQKSGWLPAIRRLFPLVRDRQFARGSVGGARQYGQPKGSATPARVGDNPSALIVNSAEGIDRKGVDALQRAIDGAAVDMAEYIARKLEGNAREVAR